MGDVKIYKGGLYLLVESATTKTGGNVMKKRLMLVSFIFSIVVFVFWAGAALASEPYLYFYHRTNARIVDGKSNYDQAKFDRVYFDITDTDPALKNVTLTIKNGSYTYGTVNQLRNNQLIEKISNNDHTFKTKYFSANKAHIPVNADGRELAFGGDANSSFSERAFSYSLDGVVVEGVLPKFRSTSEQLVSAVPYIEYILNADNQIAGLNIRFVKPENPAQALVKTPALDISYWERVLFWGADDQYFGGVRMAKSFADGEILEYQLTYDTPVDPNQVYGVAIRFGNNYQSSKISALYRWNFSAPSSGRWLVRIPQISKVEKNRFSTKEPAGGPRDGIKVRINQNSYTRWTWSVSDYQDRHANKWEIKATIERLDKGGSGVMFGRSNTGQYMALYLSGSKLTLIDYKRNSNFTEVLSEVPVSPEDQKPGTMVMEVSLQRDTQTLKCSINGTEYMDVKLSDKSKSIPTIEDYGFFSGSFKSTSASTAIYKKIETRRIGK
jgi:hypothetical protein